MGREKIKNINVCGGKKMKKTVCDEKICSLLFPGFFEAVVCKQ